MGRCDCTSAAHSQDTGEFEKHALSRFTRMQSIAQLKSVPRGEAVASALHRTHNRRTPFSTSQGAHGIRWRRDGSGTSGDRTAPQF